MEDQDLLQACEELTRRTLDHCGTRPDPALWRGLEPLWSRVLEQLHRRPCGDGSLEEAGLGYEEALQSAVLAHDGRDPESIGRRIHDAHADLRAAILRIEVPALRAIA